MSAKAIHTQRVLAVGETQGHLDTVTQAVRQYARRSERHVDLLAVHGLSGALNQMHLYINLVVLNYTGTGFAEAVPVLDGLREVYRGPILVINNDPEVDACTWGRRYAADAHTANVDRLPFYLERFLARKRTPGKTAIVFAGGGILGGFNEAGSLKALYDHGVRDFDMYIGLSAGACVAALAANGIGPEIMIEHPDIGPRDFYHLNTRDLLRQTLLVGPNLVKSIAQHFLLPHSDLLFRLSSVFTTSPFSGDRLRDRFLEVIEREGGTTDFAELRDRGRELYVMAVDLDSAERRVFGEGDDVHVPIVDAVMASSALPLLYRPVTIDGRDYIDGGIARSACLDTAIEHGADLIVCVNPLVPYTGGEAGFVKGLGLAGIAEQGLRTLIQSRLHATIEQYRRAHPRVTILNIEPETDDITMFHNPLRGDRDMIELAALNGYRSTRARLERDREFIERTFAAHGRPLDAQGPFAADAEALFHTGADDDDDASWDDEPFMEGVAE